MVSIPDIILRAAIEPPLGKGSGEPIVQAEMATLVLLKSVNCGRTGIGDLTGLEDAKKLSWLSLNGNNTDISPLAGLTSIYRLDLASNDIIELASLVANTGIHG